MDRSSRRIKVGVALATLGLMTAAWIQAGVSGAEGPIATDRRSAAQFLLKTRAPQFMTTSALSILRAQATGDRTLAAEQIQLQKGTRRASGGLAAATASSAFANTIVNDPSADTEFVDQTTQSETSIAVVGRHVAVGFNDSQHTPLFFEAGSDLSGYAYSTDGGATWTDGGVLPNAPEFVNVGDPWLTSDRDGNMYYATLAFDVFNFNGDVSVAKSTDGGKTWSDPIPTLRPPIEIFYSGDKEAITAGPDPVRSTRDNLYVAWDDFVFDGNEFSTGLPVARSTDGGKTWLVTYADRFVPPRRGCTFQQYLGVQPIVDPSDGTLYVAAERIRVQDPDCEGGQVHFSEWIFRSADGGRTFDPGIKISNAALVADGLLKLAAGSYMRLLDIPTIALRDGTLWVAWNDGALGHSHIRVARSADGGATWSLSWATQGNNDEVQPALSADESGVHILYYRRNLDNSLDVYVSDKLGKNWTATRVTSESFPGTLTLPPFDPIIAFGYMGDYIANVSDGTHRYFAWGDNRNTVTNVMWEDGRADPDVFFAKD